MKYLFKSLIILLSISMLVLNSNSITSLQIILLLLFIASNVFKENYYNHSSIDICEILIITISIKYNHCFSILYGAVIYDLIYKSSQNIHKDELLNIPKQLKKYAPLCSIYFLTLYFLTYNELIIFIFFTIFCAIISYNNAKLYKNEKDFNKIYDNERRQRYELEETKIKLMNSSKELVHIAEIKERNRIARDIHDNVGHSIAGILMQLQASYKIHSKNPEKSLELLNKSIAGLQNSLTLLRETVHNIKPKENLGIEYIHAIIANFQFCPVEFAHYGDFNLIKPNELEIICTNIKEALTNVSKYSNASKVEIKIDINEHFIRLYIKDNGQGASNIKEGLGLSGMKERIKNLGGTISIDSKNGFMIVCIIPTCKTTENYLCN